MFTKPWFTLCWSKSYMFCPPLLSGQRGITGTKPPSDSQAFVRVGSWSKRILPTPLIYCIQICDYFSVLFLFILFLNFSKKVNEQSFLQPFQNNFLLQALAYLCNWARSQLNVYLYHATNFSEEELIRTGNRTGTKLIESSWWCDPQTAEMSLYMFIMSSEMA